MTRPRGSQARGNPSSANGPRLWEERRKPLGCKFVDLKRAMPSGCMASCSWIVTQRVADRFGPVAGQGRKHGHDLSIFLFTSRSGFGREHQPKLGRAVVAELVDAQR